jgi:YggT family protein
MRSQTQFATIAKIDRTRAGDRRLQMSGKLITLFYSGSALQSQESNNIRFSDNLKEVKMSTNLAGPVARREDVQVSQQPGAEQRQVITQDVNAGQRQTLQWVTALIGFFFTVVEGLIGLRVVLKLIDANAQNAFASFIYKLTALFVAPFAGLVGNPAIGGNVLEITSLVALIVYALVAAVLIRLVWLVFYHPSSKTVTTYERNQSPPVV